MQSQQIIHTTRRFDDHITADKQAIFCDEPAVREFIREQGIIQELS
jgi:hypothetical protein